MTHDAWGYRPPVITTPDVDRVLALPRRALELDGTERAEAIIDSMTTRFARPAGWRCQCAALYPQRHADEGCITRLRLVQALALREISICGGLLGPIGTGHGKTVLDLLAPLAFQAVGIDLSVLFVPPKLVDQLVEDYEYIGQHFWMPQIVFHGHPFANTTQKMHNTVILKADAPVVHVVPYSRICLPGATDWLEQRLKPQAIIADEVHRLRNITTTSTGRRVDRYMEAHPETRFAGWSGSITSKQLADMDHLAKWALRGASPLPLKKEVTSEWAGAVQPSDNPADPGPLLKLCAPGEHIVDAFRRRFLETLGVVSTATPSVDCEVTIEELEAPPMPPAVLEALQGVRDGVRPDGEELEDSLRIAATVREVACGFYYRWIFPKCEFPRDEALVEEWREARAEFFREVRNKLKTAEEHLDSPKLVTNAAKRFHGDMSRDKKLPEWQSHAWPRWRAAMNTVYYESDPVLIDDYLIQAVARWAKENVGVIWYEHAAFGHWIAEAAQLPLFGGGKDARERLLGNPKKQIPGEDGSRSVICSIKSLGTGTNGMQHRWSRAFFPAPMSSPDAWEQGIARLVRIGQPAPIVRNEYFAHTDELKKAFQSALLASQYVEGILGARTHLVRGLK